MVAWGDNSFGQTNVPVGLSNVVAVAANVGGSITSQVAVLTVIVPPLFTTQPTNQTIIAGSDVSLNAAATGIPAPTYQWQLYGTNLPGRTETSLTLTNTLVLDTGNYTVVAANEGGAVTSEVAVLTVVIPPSFTVQPTNQAVNAGDDVGLYSVATGVPEPTYQWQLYGTNLPGQTGSSLTLGNLQTGGAGDYTVVAANLGGSVTSEVAVLTVLASAPVITAQPQSRLALLGQDVTITVTAKGTAPLSYQWQCAGTNLMTGGRYSGVNGTVLALNYARTNDTGGYSVIVGNDYDSVTSEVAVLTVLVPPPPVIQLTDGTLGVVAGQFGLNVIGWTGQVVSVEASTNLLNWLPVWTNTLDTGMLRFSDPSAATLPGRFYRARGIP